MAAPSSTGSDRSQEPTRGVRIGGPRTRSFSIDPLTWSVDTPLPCGQVCVAHPRGALPREARSPSGGRLELPVLLRCCFRKPLVVGCSVRGVTRTDAGPGRAVSSADGQIFIFSGNRAVPSGLWPQLSSRRRHGLLASMLTGVGGAATLIREAREGAGLSLRSLADRSDVSFTTICRIEHGQVDPTTGTLRKLLGAMGQDLELRRRPVPRGPQLAELADAWSTDRAGQDRPDWTRLRTFLDYLARRPELAEPAIRSKPPASGSTFFDSLLAGIAEKIADDAAGTRPAWTKRVPALTEIWESFGTPRMRAQAEATAPHQLALRNIYIPTTSLWRHSA